ncbi:hypothetical protein ACERHZ_09105 [Lactobacillus acidophilus]|uniref:hypothetical protein n=1 Tax=Lactobacillus acidophilus TaxID=1579 RepID=UPI003A69601F
MLPDKKRQIIGSIIGMLILLVIAITANLGNGTWSAPRIAILVAGLVMILIAVVYRIIQIFVLVLKVVGV